MYYIYKLLKLEFINYKNVTLFEIMTKH